MVAQQRLKQACLPDLMPKDGGASFLIVVTFDNLYLGNNQVFRAIFGDIILPRLEAKFGNPLPLPLDNIFFLTIKELEDLLSRVQLGLTTIGAALQFAKDQDTDRETQKFLFEQHLESLGPNGKLLPFLDQGLNDLFERCIQRLPPEERLI